MKTLIRTAVTATALATVAAACACAPEGAPPGRTSLGAVRLVAYTGCDDLLAGLREQAARNVGPYGFGNVMPMTARAEAKADTGAYTPEHSTTNVHEAGVDEPDLVKTDGDRLVTVTDGTLRIIDTATRKVTESLDLTDGDGAGVPADLLISGDRALVMLRGGGAVYRSFGPPRDTRYVLVDLAGEPKVLSTVEPQGTYVDARMVGSTVRLVTRSQPDITFPQVRRGDIPEAERVKRNQEAVRKAPAEAWLPKIKITDASGTAEESTVECDRVSHPADYTGTSMLTVHTIDLARGVTGTDPIALAADGDIVYGTGGSLYVASNPLWWGMPFRPLPVAPTTRPGTPTSTPDMTASPDRATSPGGTSRGVAPAEEPTPSEFVVTATVTESPTLTVSATSSPPPVPRPAPTLPPEETQIHRFDVSKPGPPAYVASGKVAGRLLNQYSLSEHEGHLRVATTLNSREGQSSSSTVHVLDAATMEKKGEVGGLGKGERIYSVRFIGPVGYAVTFKQVDPLYTLDLRDPAAPRVTGELKITGYSAYLHPAGDGRLIGIGQEANEEGRTQGTQVSLFDVSDPASPRRLSQLFQKDSGSEAEWDPHAFLYWPRTGLAVIPLRSGDESGALALKIDDSGVSKLGMIRHPAQRGENERGFQPGIQRSVVIGDSLWTVSPQGVQVNDAATLAEQAWIPAG
ncbi:beta-propeller domain-containing protein [Nonomuraea sp. B5E05]|uniref:beta-propeller domain-containing protein n=1 Tax=Nonomuraea sp. B5E05 TaxID=3153569 RepID=UPI003260582D